MEGAIRTLKQARDRVYMCKPWPYKYHNSSSMEHTN